MLVKETEQAELRAIIQAHARDVVVSKLKIISSKKKLPGDVRPLVLKHWSTLMLNNYIKHGKDSQEWVQSVLLLKLLLKCMQPVKDKKQYTLLKNNHAVLVEAVNDSLYETRQDKQEIDSQVSQLNKLFMKMIDNYSFEMPPETNKEEEQKARDSLRDSEAKETQYDEKAAAADNIIAFGDRNETTTEKVEEALPAFVPLDEEDESLDEEALAAQERIDIAREKIARLGSETRPGDWYEVYNGEDRAVRRLKLSVILTEAAKLIFVDRRGVKVIEKDVSDFIEELNDNRSRMIADHSAFDNALGKVIHSLAA